MRTAGFKNGGGFWRSDKNWTDPSTRKIGHHLWVAGGPPIFNIPLGVGQAPATALSGGTTCAPPNFSQCLRDGCVPTSVFFVFYPPQADKSVVRAAFSEEGGNLPCEPEGVESEDLLAREPGAREKHKTHLTILSVNLYSPNLQMGDFHGSNRG